MNKSSFEDVVYEEYFECRCGGATHRIKTSRCKDGSFFSFEVYLSVWEGFFRRVWKAFKYLFKWDIPCYHECLFHDNDIDRLVHELTEWKKQINNKKKEK